MRYRFTDSQLPTFELELELGNPSDWWDDNEPEVDEEQAQELLDWWTTYPNRAAEIHDEGGHIVVIQHDNMQTGPQIGWWCQSMSDTAWQLSDFPYTTLHYEEVES